MKEILSIPGFVISFTDKFMKILRFIKFLIINVIGEGLLFLLSIPIAVWEDFEKRENKGRK